MAKRSEKDLWDGMRAATALNSWERVEALRRIIMKLYAGPINATELAVLQVIEMEYSALLGCDFEAEMEA